MLPARATPNEVLRAATAMLDGGGRVALATVVARKGSTPSTPGQKLALLESPAGEPTRALAAVGTVGGGAVEHAVMEELRSALRSSSPPRVHSFRLGPTLGMCCGGQVEVLVETLTPSNDVVLIGGGHVARATAPLLALLGFSVRVCDERDEVAEAWTADAPSGVRFVHGSFDDPIVLEGVRRPTAHCLVMTHDHALDQRAVEWALGVGFAFVGGVGSRAKAERTRARLEAKGVREEDRARVRMPIGLDIGARSPEEIAVSIAAELVARRAGRTATA